MVWCAVNQLTALDVPILRSLHPHYYFHKGRVDDYPINVDGPSHPINTFFQFNHDSTELNVKCRNQPASARMSAVRCSGVSLSHILDRHRQNHVDLNPNHHRLRYEMGKLKLVFIYQFQNYSSVLCSLQENENESFIIVCCTTRISFVLRMLNV